NYIKRLIGLPRETIAIHYGKLYTHSGLDYDEADREVFSRDPGRQDYKSLNDQEAFELLRWEKEYMHEDNPRALELFTSGKFRILRKPPAQLLAERRLVFDNDHQAKDLIGKVPPRWAPEPNDGAWTLDNPDEPRRFQHMPRSDGELDWLRYHHYIPD